MGEEKLIRKARLGDINAIKALMDTNAAKQIVLPRSVLDIISSLRDFFVFEKDSKVVGCVALHLCWFDLAEIRSLAVEESEQGKGIGSALVQQALEEAKEIGLKRVFTLTCKQAFFEKNFFKTIEKAELPQKVWSECINCPRFLECNEIAMAIDSPFAGQKA